MIARSDMIPLLLQSCPSFARAWQDYADSSEFDAELGYVHLGEVARHIVDLAKQNLRSEFEAVFIVVERLHVEGDAYVREAATIGLLEGIQNIASHAGVDAELFRQYLRPVSLRWWDKLNRLWAGDPCPSRVGAQNSLPRAGGGHPTSSCS
jgi:hypothetical protein